MTFIPILVVLVALAAGLARIGFEKPPGAPINALTAKDLSVCLRDGKEIPAATKVALVPLSWETSSAAKLGRADKIAFVATAPIQVEIAPADREAADKSTTIPGSRSFTVGKSAGAFEFELEDGKGVMLHRGDARFLLQPSHPLRFGPADNVTYRITLQDVKFASKDEGGKKVPVLPVGQQGTVYLGAGQTVMSLQPISPAFWMFETPPVLTPLRGFGQGGQADLTIEARQPGVGFGDTGFGLRACVRQDEAYELARTEPQGSKKPGEIRGWRTAGIVDTKPREAGAATVRLSLPSDILPAWGWMVPIHIAVVSLDGQYMSFGGLTAIGKWPSALIATLVTVLLFGWLGKLRRRDLEPAPAAPAPAAPAPAAPAPGGTWLSRSWNTSSEWIAGLFIGPDKDPSLSLFQIFFWTVITVWGLAYVYVVTGSLLSMTQSMMWLLGIAGTGSVIARWISSGTSGGSTSQPPGGSIAIVAAPAGARPKPLAFWQLLSTAGQFDLLKLQLFVFTLLIGAYVAWRIADTGAFPELDTNTLLLLGVSQGVYIGGKIASTTALSRAQALKAELDLTKEARKNADDEVKRLATKRADLEAKKTAGTITASEDKDLQALPALIKQAEEKAKDLGEKTAKLEKDYAAALKEMGLIQASS